MINPQWTPVFVLNAQLKLTATLPACAGCLRHEGERQRRPHGVTLRRWPTDGGGPTSDPERTDEIRRASALYDRRSQFSRGWHFPSWSHRQHGAWMVLRTASHNDPCSAKADNEQKPNDTSARDRSCGGAPYLTAVHTTTDPSAQLDEKRRTMTIVPSPPERVVMGPESDWHKLSTSAVTVSIGTSIDPPAILAKQNAARSSLLYPIHICIMLVQLIVLRTVASTIMFAKNSVEIKESPHASMCYRKRIEMVPRSGSNQQR
ncbi:hypothetical protein C8Q74DRAFT_1216176 [Fomes fomentarius]|nr:hypothetical protein C8Q74DRAFT_1216176 [Fomes fomentarius]